MKKLLHMSSLKHYMKPSLSDILTLIAVVLCVIIFVVHTIETYNTIIVSNRGYYANKR